MTLNMSQSYESKGHTSQWASLPLMVTEHVPNLGKCLTEPVQWERAWESTIHNVLSFPNLPQVPLNPAILMAPCSAYSSSPGRHTCPTSISHPAPCPLLLPASSCPSPIWSFLQLLLKAHLYRTCWHLHRPICISQRTLYNDYISISDNHIT